MTKKNLKKHKLNCPICGKPHETEEWIEDFGTLKGQRVIKNAFCSPECRKRFGEDINL